MLILLSGIFVSGSVKLAEMMYFNILSRHLYLCHFHTLIFSCVMFIRRFKEMFSSSEENQRDLTSKSPVGRWGALFSSLEKNFLAYKGVLFRVSCSEKVFK